MCSQYGFKINREEAVGWDKWNGAPVDSIAWQLPIQVFFFLNESFPFKQLFLQGNARPPLTTILLPRHPHL